MSFSCTIIGALYAKMGQPPAKLLSQTGKYFSAISN